MNTHSRSPLSIIIVLVCLLVCLFWGLVKTVPVYDVALAGVIFELLWLPMIGALFVLPVLTFLMWYKEGFRLKSFSLFAFILITSLAIIMGLSS